MLNAKSKLLLLPQSITHLITMTQLPRLRSDQAEILKFRSRVKVLAMGRRWGKTHMCGVLALASADYGGNVAWVAPTYKNARALWRFALSMCAGTNAEIKRAEKIVEFPSGGALSVYSADNSDALRGDAFDLVILDEAAHVDEYVWHNVILPTLADRDGKALLVSTPRGRNWFWREFQKGAIKNQDYASWTAPSSANPLSSIQQAALRAKKTLPSHVYRQEWLAEFVDDSESVFSQSSIARAIELYERLPQRDTIKVAGVDWAGTTHRDYTVAVVVAVDEVSRVVDILRFSASSHEESVARVASFLLRHGPLVTVSEINGLGAPLTEMLEKQGIRVRRWTTTNATKAAAVENFIVMLEQGKLAILNDDVLIRELMSFGARRTTGGAVTYAAIGDNNDDVVMAMAFALTACRAATTAFTFA